MGGDEGEDGVRRGNEGEIRCKTEEGLWTRTWGRRVWEKMGRVEGRGRKDRQIYYGVTAKTGGPKTLGKRQGWGRRT